MRACADGRRARQVFCLSNWDRAPPSGVGALRKRCTLRTGSGGTDCNYAITLQSSIMDISLTVLKMITKHIKPHFNMEAREISSAVNYHKKHSMYFYNTS